MKILFLIERLTGGGAERVCVSVANSLAALGHSISILSHAVSNRDYDLDRRIKVYTVSMNDNKFSRQWRETKCFIKIIKKDNIEIVVNVLGIWFLQSIFLSKLLGAKIVFSDHNPYERPANALFPFSRVQKLNKFFFAKFCNCTTVLTNRDKEILGDRNNVVVMPNPLFLPILNYVPKKEKTILAVGRFHVWEVKGFDLLIKAWGKICREYPEWNLKIIGDCNGKERLIVEGFILEANANNVSVEPFRKNIMEDYQKSEIFVLSSRYEGFGLVLIEAMSQRCACIACDYKTRQEDIITDGVDGLLCKSDDAEDLTEKLRQLVSDKELRHHLQQNSTLSLDKYKEENIAKLWEKVLSNLL